MSAENSDSINAAMSQAQVFASAWALVGGPFDNGDAMAHANEAKQELHDMLKVLHGTGFSFEQHLHRQRRFSERTFGPGSRAAGGAVFVKHGPFFRDQGGLTEDWGKNWTRIRAGSLKHARQVGEELLP
ncbi:TPA: hypothetical protein ACHTN5_001537 [Pseudomonas aeruginosa]